mgnify:CR=1 FL=1
MYWELHNDLMLNKKGAMEIWESVIDEQLTE